MIDYSAAHAVLCVPSQGDYLRRIMQSSQTHSAYAVCKSRLSLTAEHSRQAGKCFRMFAHQWSIWYISLLSGIANAIVSHARRLMMAQTHLLASGDIAAAFVVANTGKQLVEFDGDPFCQQKVSGASTVL